MTTELTTWNDRPTELTAHSAAQTLIDWALGADAAYSLAQKLVTSAFCPESFRGKPIDAAAAILSGAEVGLSPMAALRSFDVIQGQAAPRAITLRAICQAQGHDIEVVESGSTRCVMRGRRRGSNDWQKVTWTMDRAKQLGVTGKSNWKTQPQAMLVARATSELARLIAADAILGIAYSAEEIADGGTGEQVSATLEPTVTGTRTMGRKVAVVPEPEAEAEAEAEVDADLEPPTLTADEPIPPDEPEGITDGQMKRLHATFTERGITEREARLAFVSDVLGVDVFSSSDLTKTQASIVIDRLAQ